MFAVVFVMDIFLPLSIWYLLLEVAAGIVVYAVMLLILRVQFVYDYLRIYRDKIAGKFKKDNK